MHQSNAKYNTEFPEHIYKQKNRKFELPTIRSEQKIEIISFRFKISTTNIDSDTFDLSCRSSFELSEYQKRLSKSGDRDFSEIKSLLVSRDSAQIQ